jgi:hypothetical protein
MLRKINVTHFLHIKFAGRTINLVLIDQQRVGKRSHQMADGHCQC